MILTSSPCTRTNQRRGQWARDLVSTNESSPGQGRCRTAGSCCGAPGWTRSAGSRSSPSRCTPPAVCNQGFYNIMSIGVLCPLSSEKLIVPCLCIRCRVQFRNLRIPDEVVVFLPVMIVYKLTLTSLGLVNFFLQLINLLQLPFPTVLRRHLDNQSAVSIMISTNESSPCSCPSS